MILRKTVKTWLMANSSVVDIQTYRLKFATFAFPDGTCVDITLLPEKQKKEL